MSSHEKIESMFDSMAKEFVNDEAQTGGVVLGIFSEDECIGFNAAHGDLATITALITTIIERTAENAEMHPLDLLLAITRAVASNEREERN